MLLKLQYALFLTYIDVLNVVYSLIMHYMHVLNVREIRVKKVVTADIELTAYWTQSAAEGVAYMTSCLSDSALLC